MLTAPKQWDSPLPVPALAVAPAGAGDAEEEAVAEEAAPAVAGAVWDGHTAAGPSAPCAPRGACGARQLVAVAAAVAAAACRRVKTLPLAREVSRATRAAESAWNESELAANRTRYMAPLPLLLLLRGAALSWGSWLGAGAVVPPCWVPLGGCEVEVGTEAGSM